MNSKKIYIITVDVGGSKTNIGYFSSGKLIKIINFSTKKYGPENINKISAKNKDIFKNALSDKENPNRIICVDHSFLGFDYGSKQNFIKP